MTIVISVRGKDRAALLADPNFVYVGRACRGWPASIWGNPFKVDKQVAAKEALLNFEKWLKNQPKLMAVIGELRGKTLGCWCKNWRPGEPEIQCHAVILAKLADALTDEKY